MALQLPMAPINYNIDTPDPSQTFLQAFKDGAAINEARMAQEKAQREAEQQQQLSQAFQRLRQPGATAKDYADLAMTLPETHAKSVRESFNMINTEQQQNALSDAAKVFSAFKSGKPDIAINMLEHKIQSKRNSGDEEGAKFIETWRDVAKQDPKAAEAYFGFTISQMPGGKEVLENYSRVSAAQTDEAFQQIMAGANTVDQVFERVPQLAQMGEKGLEFANKMLTQQRLREKQLAEGMDLSKQQQDEAKESRQAAAVLKAVFGPDAFSVGTPSKAAGTEQPPVAEAEGSTIAQEERPIKERPIMVATAGSLEGLLALRPTKKFIEAVGKGEVQITPQQASVLGLDENTTTLIRSIAASDPETAADMITTALKMKIKAQTAAQKPQQLTATEREVIAAGFQQGTPEYVAAMREKLKLGPGAITRIEDRVKAEGDLRKEYNQQTAVYRDVEAAYGRVLASEDTAVGDLSLIFGYMKMLDPGSVVREGEFATAQNAAGVPERIQNIYNRVMRGERLSSSQRSSFKGQAGKLYSTAKAQESSVRNGLSRIAKGYGLNPANIFYDVSGDAAPAAPVAPAAQPAQQAVPPAAPVVRDLLNKYGGKK